MAGSPFVHLHCHTDYSLLDGACEISQLLDAAARLEMPAIAITDHGNLFGAVHFYHEALRRGLRPVIGCEVYVSQQSRKITSESNRYHHLILLCENLEGYRNLIKLVSTGYLDGFYYKPRIDKDLLREHSEGLIALSACLGGEVQARILQNRLEQAERVALEFKELFGEDFYMEMQDQGFEKEQEIIPYQKQLSAKTGIPLVATNDAHYLNHDDADLHDTLLCIGTKALKKSERDRKSTRLNSSHIQKSRMPSSA